MCFKSNEREAAMMDKMAVEVANHWESYTEESKNWYAHAHSSLKTHLETIKRMFAMAMFYHYIVGKCDSLSFEFRQELEQLEHEVDIMFSRIDSLSATTDVFRY